MIINCWSDFTCPFCYIAENRLHRAISEMGLEKECKVVFRAFELNPKASREPKRTIVEGFARHYGMSPEEASGRVGDIEAMARGDGLEFNYGTARATNTFDALRVAKLAQSKSNDAANAFVLEMYRDFFERNMVLSDPGVIADAAARVGLDRDEAEKVISGDAFTDEVRNDERAAYEMGLHAVPFILVNGRYGIPGAIETDQFKQVLGKAFREEEDGPSVTGNACGPDGCDRRPQKG